MFQSYVTGIWINIEEELNSYKKGRNETPGRGRRTIWLWVGVILLSISALFWLILIIAIVADPENAGHKILGGLLFSIILIGVGIYSVRRGKRRYRRRVL